MTQSSLTPPASDFAPKVANPQVVIASGQTTSGPVDLSGCVLCGLYLPTLTGSNISFQGSPDGVTYSTVYNGASALSIAKEAGYVALDYTKFLGLRFLQLVSDGTEGAARTITLAARPM